MTLVAPAEESIPGRCCCDEVAARGYAGFAFR
jgi:hypothetical protein